VPIADMLEIEELDTSIPAESMKSARPGIAPQRSASPGAAEMDEYAAALRPIGAPLVFSGFSEEVVRRFAPEFAAAGIVPVQGAGSASEEKQPEPLEPGSAVTAVLVRGDMNIAAACTVTLVDAGRLLACGHPLLQFGMVDIPMNKARVLATVASPMNSFKIVNATEPAGTFVQDRFAGILGRMDRVPEMIPVHLTLRGGPQPKEVHYEVLNNPRLTPVAVMATVFNALRGGNEYGEEVTYRLAGRIRVTGYPDVTMNDMYAPPETNLPTAFAVALALGAKFNQIFVHPYSRPTIEGVELDFDLIPERRSARLESARTDVIEARPGEEMTIEAVLRPYRGERLVRQLAVRIPASAPKGPLRILVSDGDTLDRMRQLSLPFGRPLDLASTIALLNKDRVNHRLYVSVLQSNPQAMVQDKVMPALPLSVMNVMDGLRGTREMVVTGESAMGESSTPLDYVVSGAQVLSVMIK